MVILEINYVLSVACRVQLAGRQRSTNVPRHSTFVFRTKAHVPQGAYAVALCGMRSVRLLSGSWMWNGKSVVGCDFNCSEFSDRKTLQSGSNWLVFVSQFANTFLFMYFITCLFHLCGCYPILCSAELRYTKNAWKYFDVNVIDTWVCRTVHWPAVTPSIRPVATKCRISSRNV